MATLIAIIVTGMFATGAVVGVIAIVCLGIRREERDFSLTHRAPNRMVQGTRFLTGLYVRHRSDMPGTRAA